jgi:hypothetical protein
MFFFFKFVHPRCVVDNSRKKGQSKHSRVLCNNLYLAYVSTYRCLLDDIFRPITLGHLQVYNYVMLKQTNICNACQNTCCHVEELN